MSDRTPERRPEPGVPAPLSGPEWWATLEPPALEDEIEHNRRGERWLLLVGAVAVVCTILALILHQVTT